MSTAALHDIGSNQGPPLAEMAHDDMTAAVAPIAARGAELLAAAERAAVVDTESAARAADLVKMIRVASTKLDDAHREVKAPYLAAGRVVDGLRADVNATLDRAKRTIDQKLNQFVAEERAKAETERRRQEEIARAAQKAAEEARSATEAQGYERAAQQAVARAADVAPPRIEGDLGGRATAKTEWVATVTDYVLAFNSVWANSIVIEAVDKAVKAMVRAGARDIPGVKIVAQVKTVVR